MPLVRRRGRHNLALQAIPGMGRDPIHEFGRDVVARLS
jgi:hypothetical protein